MELGAAKTLRKDRKQFAKKSGSSLGPRITISVLCASNHKEIQVKVRLSKRIMEPSKPYLAGNG
jgi:hypothetical protein